MRRYGMMMLAIAFGLSMFTVPVFAATYVDNFANGADAGWVPLIGEWKAEGGVYKQVSEGDKWQRAMLKTINGQDYNVSDFEVSVTAQLPTGKSGWLGLVFLHDKIDPAKAAVPHYTYSLTYDGRNIVRIYKSPSGAVGKVDWVVDKPLNAETGKWYTHKVVVKGKKIECYSNDKLLITKEDPDILKAGKVGIFATKAPGAILGEFRLTAPNIPGGVTPVRPVDKLAVTWGGVKAEY